ncbi:MAG: putative S-layer protein [Candidatus Pacearchaeota archaeon]
MKNKIVFFIALIALMVLSINAVLALSVSVIKSPANVYPGQNTSVTFNITNNGESNITSGNLIVSNLSSSNINIVPLESQSFSNLAVNNSIIRTYSITTTEDSDIGFYTVTLTAAGTNGTENFTASSSTNFNVLYDYCGIGSNKTSPIRVVEIKNENDLKKETYKPLESFDIKLKIQNLDDEEDLKVIIEAVLIRGNSEVDDTDVKKSIKIDADDTESVTLNMTVPADIDEGIYYLYIKVYNDDDEDNCMQSGLYSKMNVIPIEIKKKSRELVLNVNMPANVSCGTSTTLAGSILNIGKKDEERIKIEYLINEISGTPVSIVIDNFDSGDKSLLNFPLKIPKNLTEGDYTATFNVYYDYDEDDEIYGDVETTIYMFKVLGNCQMLVSNQTITTEVSTAIIGIESEVRIKIKNTGDNLETFTISASADWANINSITPSSIALTSGQEKEVIIKLTAKSGTTIGAHNLIVNVQHNGISESKTVAVNVQQSSQPSGLIDQIKFQMKYNPTWVIIDAALIIAIIIVIILLLVGKKSA